MSKSFRAWVWPACALLALAVFSPLAARAQEPKGLLSEPRPSLAEQKILAALASQSEVNFVDQPLADVVQFLKEKHQIEIQLDNKALTDEGIGFDTPVTRHLENVSLESLLQLILGEMDMTFVPKHEVLVITTRTEAENMLITRFYPVGDLLESEGEDLIVGVGKPHHELIEAIASLIAPTTWDEVGGPGHIKLIGGAQSLAISQTFECHREIEEFLAALRAAKRQRPAAKPQAAAKAADDDAISLKIYKLPWQWAYSPNPPANPGPDSPAPVAPAKPEPTKQEPPKAGAKAKAPPAVHAQMGGGFGPNAQSHPTVEQLAKALPAAIEPESWTQAGGQGTISVVGRALAIRQTSRIHGEIRRFLEALN
jgi:hypothetical protein